MYSNNSCQLSFFLKIKKSRLFITVSIAKVTTGAKNDNCKKLKPCKHNALCKSAVIKK